jgi:hypothetical protein
VMSARYVKAWKSRLLTMFCLPVVLLWNRAVIPGATTRSLGHYDFIGAHLRDGLILFSDLTGHGAGNGGTFPPNIIATSQRPDIVINREGQQIIIFELTCPWDQNTDKMHTFKTDKYAALLNDLLHAGFKVDLFCFEVSMRGQITKANKAQLKSFLLKARGMKRACSLSLINNVSKAVLLSSFSIFCARNEMVWSISHNMSVHMKS